VPEFEKKLFHCHLSILLLVFSKAIQQLCEHITKSVYIEKIAQRLLSPEQCGHYRFLFTQ
jgi:hypothetical protein